MNWEFDVNWEFEEYDYEDWAQVRGGLHGLGVLGELDAPRALGAPHVYGSLRDFGVWVNLTEHAFWRWTSRSLTMSRLSPASR